MCSLSMLRTLPLALGACLGLRFIDPSITSISLPFDGGIDLDDFDDDFDVETGAAATVAHNVLLPLLAANPTLVVRLFSDLHSGRFVESERAAARG